MPNALQSPPPRRLDLAVCAFSDGQYVVKDPRTRAYFNLGEQEHFLFSQLDGLQSEEAICSGFEARFGEELSTADVRDFVELVEARGLLQSAKEPSPRRQVENANSTSGFPEDETDDVPAAGKGRRRQSLLFCRFSVFDPDRLFNWLEPKVRVIWTPGFLAFSAACIAASTLLAWSNRYELASLLPSAMRWETLFVIWITVVVVTTLHEFAHGLTCKHYGGQVHEVGVLFMFLTPCFYCDVSDAWLIPQKSRRLWVTLAGGYCDLFLWALATFTWRLTIESTLVNFLAGIVLSVCGARVFFNFNPLLKLDGYYLLSDWLEIPNLRRRGWDYWLAKLRWMLWGAPRPPPPPRARALAWYGMVSWLFSFVFLDIMFFNLFKYLGSRWGILGFSGTIFLGAMAVRRLFQGFSAGEFSKMIMTRHSRTACWGLGLACVPLALFLVRIEDRAGGAFQVRPGTRVEVRAPVAGFLKEVQFDEGEQVTPNSLIATMEIPDLASLIAQKQAAVRESEANLRRLKVGSRPEEIAEQKLRVERAQNWRNLARQDLAKSETGLQEEFKRLDQQIAQSRTELDFARHAFVQSERLYNKGVLAGEQFRNDKKKLQLAESQWQEDLALKRTRQASGTLEFEAELARREKELADTQATLALLEAGARPEDLDAERARLARLQEELSYNQSLEGKVLLHSPVPGLVTTPRLHEKVGQYFEKGALICTIEEISCLEAEVAVPEDELEGVALGQTVELKARALPFRTFEAKVDRIAPIATADPGDRQGTVTVYCRVPNPRADLRSGMTGFGRIYRQRQPVAMILGNRAVRHLRTEFWW